MSVEPARFQIDIAIRCLGLIFHRRLSRSSTYLMLVKMGVETISSILGSFIPRYISQIHISVSFSSTYISHIEHFTASYISFIPRYAIEITQDYIHNPTSQVLAFLDGVEGKGAESQTGLSCHNSSSSLDQGRKSLSNSSNSIVGRNFEEMRSSGGRRSSISNLEERRSSTSNIMGERKSSFSNLSNQSSTLSPPPPVQVTINHLSQILFLPMLSLKLIRHNRIHFLQGGLQ